VRVLVIVNLHSGGSDAGLYDYARALGTEGVEVVMRFITESTRIEEMLDDAREFDTVVAAGGDGTVSAVCYATRNSGVPVLVYPAGTANLLALNLGLPLDAPRLAEMTLRGVPISFDMGELEHHPATGSPTRSGFIVMAGAGYDAAIMESAQPLKPVFGAAAYLLAAVGNIAPTKAEFELVMDGRTVCTDGIAVLLVNFGRIQFDLAVTHDWDPRDGLFDVAVVRTKNAAGLLPVVFAAMLDRLGDYPERTGGIEVHRAAEITVSANPPLRTQCDGEVLEELTPLTARCLARAATLLVPVDSPFAASA